MKNFLIRLASSLIGGFIMIWAILNSQLTFFYVVVLALALSFIEIFMALYSSRKLKYLPGIVSYVAIGFIFFYQIGNMSGSYNAYFILYVLFVIWASDTGAYLIGKNFGKTKLWEKVSPKKTWEGFIGGLFVALITGIVLNNIWKLMPIYNVVLTSIIIVLFGTLGDLLESIFKRKLEIKDSGKMIPGHGGILDRFDSLLLAAPVFYLYLKVFHF